MVNGKTETAEFDKRNFESVSGSSRPMSGNRLHYLLLRCTCDDHRMQLAQTGTNCVTANTSKMPGYIAGNPVSTSTPHPELSHEPVAEARVAEQATRCPIYYARTKAGCVRQYFCTDGRSSLGGPCTCESNCRSCHLRADGIVQCLESRTLSGRY